VNIDGNDRTFLDGRDRPSGGAAVQPLQQTVPRAVAALLTCVVVLGAYANSAGAQSVEALLDTAYPRAMLRPAQVTLTPSQRKQALERADADIPSVLITRYIATRDGTVVGRAYLDTNTIRSNAATLLVALDGDGKVLSVEVTAFAESGEQRPPAAWLQQFRGMTLTDDLGVNRAIQPMTSAPFTTRAVTNAVRRVLAIDAVLETAVPR
jgi:Na+-translocating ferredoxin:NAD+ oxidoreductase RnfG subunit